MAIDGTAGDDSLVGTKADETFTLEEGGADTVKGRDGDDLISLGATFDADDVLDAGDGADTVDLFGDYSGGLDITGSMLKHVETLLLRDDFSYDLSLKDAAVAAGAVLTVDIYTAPGAAQGAKVDASKESNGQISFIGGAGDDTLIGGKGEDIFQLDLRGGADSVKGGLGDDDFYFGALLDADDTVLGGDGHDQLHLEGDYSAGLTLKGGDLKEIESLTLWGEFDYNLTFKDSAIIAGTRLSVTSFDVYGHSILFDGSDETDASFSFYTGEGDDTVLGGALDDDFLLGVKGGADSASGGGGDDYFDMHTLFAEDDRIDGGDGYDTMFIMALLNPVVCGADTLQNMEEITLGNVGFHFFDLTIADTTVSAGATLTVTSTQTADQWGTHFNGSAETDGALVLIGAAGHDTLIGGAMADNLVGAGEDDSLSGSAGADTLYGGLGADTLAGGAGPTVFVYNDPVESSAEDFFHDPKVFYDHIKAIKPRLDHFDLNVVVTGIDPQVKTGLLHTVSGGDIEREITANELKAGHAVVFKPDQGQLAGHIYLIVDANGVDGFQRDVDYLFEVDEPSHLNLLTTDFFI